MLTDLLIKKYLYNLELGKFNISDRQKCKLKNVNYFGKDFYKCGLLIVLTNNALYLRCNIIFALKTLLE